MVNIQRKNQDEILIINKYAFIINKLLIIINKYAFIMFDWMVWTYGTYQLFPLVTENCLICNQISKDLGLYF